MKNNSNSLSNRFPFIVAALLLAASLLLQTTPVQAALGIISVSPNTIPYNTSPTIEIVGSDFLPGAYASLTGGINLATTFINITTLNAVVPAGLAPGTRSGNSSLSDRESPKPPGSSRRPAASLR